LGWIILHFSVSLARIEFRWWWWWGGSTVIFVSNPTPVEVDLRLC